MKYILLIVGLWIVIININFDDSVVVSNSLQLCDQMQGIGGVLQDLRCHGEAWASHDDRVGRSMLFLVMGGIVALVSGGLIIGEILEKNDKDKEKITKAE